MTQKSIQSFFKPVNKRSVDESDDHDCAPKKKQLLDSTINTDKENVSSPCLTPDQKDRMNQNKILAQIKLQCKQTSVIHHNIGSTWFNALKDEFSKDYFQKLSNYVSKERSEHKIYPSDDKVYSWTHYSKIDDIKVVILGQDPYHGIGQAHGLCFSVQKGISVPPSLLNMYKELEKDIPGFQRPNHGLLVGWAKQGVLLLNACLSVRANNANSHKDRGWEIFTDAVIKKIAERNSSVVFLLWGAYAQKKAVIINKEKHHLLYAPHPSPLSAHKGFFGCEHFSKCNQILIDSGRTPINWTILPLEEV